MSWARIMAPLAGAQSDRELLTAAAALASAFDAELACVHAPADMADLMPWMGEGFMGGVQVTALESLKDAAVEGARACGAMAAEIGYSRTRVVSLDSPVWAGLAMEGRLSDVIVFDSAAARGKGPLAEAFQQLVADEQRPVVVARPGLKVGGVAVVAWDGGKEASRAMRTALPLLQKASSVIIAGAPSASSRNFDVLRWSISSAREACGPRPASWKARATPRACCWARPRRRTPTSWWRAPSGIPACRSSSSAAPRAALLNGDGPSLFLSH
jgi:hypothetical protein